MQKITVGRPSANRLWRWITALALLCAATPAVTAVIPVEAWSHDPLIASVAISPDGSKLAALTAADANSLPSVTVWETADMSKPPVRFAPDDSKVLGVWWASNDQLFFVGTQKTDYKFGGRTKKSFKNFAYLADAGGVKIRELLRHRLKIQDRDIIAVDFADRLIAKPDTILLHLED